MPGKGDCELRLNCGVSTNERRFPGERMSDNCSLASSQTVIKENCPLRQFQIGDLFITGTSLVFSILGDVSD